jgi:hypothetical protein
MFSVVELFHFASSDKFILYSATPSSRTADLMEATIKRNGAIDSHRNKNIRMMEFMLFCS